MNPGWIALAGLGAGILFLASVVVPPLGLVMAMMSPLPVAWATQRGGSRVGTFALGISLVPVLSVVGPSGAALYMAQFGGPGWVLGYTAASSGWSPHRMVGGYTGTALAATTVVLVGSAWWHGTGADQWIIRTVEEARRMMAAALDLAAQPPETRVALEQMLGEVAAALVRLFPGLFAGVTILTGWANGLLLRHIAKPIAVPPWTLWRAPEACIWALIGSGFLGVLGQGWMESLGWNLFLALVAVYFLQGLAILEHLFASKRVPRLLRITVYVIVLLQLPAMVLIAALGAFDLWLDFRSRWAPSRPSRG